MSDKDLNKLSTNSEPASTSTGDLTIGAHINKGFGGSADLTVSSNNDAASVSNINEMVSSTTSTIANGYIFVPDKSSITESKPSSGASSTVPVQQTERKQSNDLIPLVPLKSEIFLNFIF